MDLLTALALTATLAALSAFVTVVFGVRQASRRARTAHIYELVTAGSAALEPDDARPFAEALTDMLRSASGRLSRTSLTLTRTFDGTTVQVWLTVSGCDDPGAREGLLRHLRRTLKVETRPVERIELPDTPVYATSKKGRRDGRERIGAVAAWATETAAALETAGPAFVAVGIEALSVREVTAHRRWLKAVLTASSSENPDTHPQATSGKLTRARIVAGAGSGPQATALITTGANYLPGYDFTVGATVVTDLHLAAPTVLAGLFATLALWSTVPVYVALLPFLAAGALALPLVSGAADLTAKPVSAGLAAGVVHLPQAPVVRRFQLVWQARRALRRTADLWRTARHHDVTSRRQLIPGDPRPAAALICAPVQTAALVMPADAATATAASATASTAQVAAPAALRQASGVPLGADPEGHIVVLPDADRYQSLFLVGDRGKGKSMLQHLVWAGDLAARNDADPARRTVAAATTPLLLDVKGDSETADVAGDIAGRLGLDDQMLRFDLAATSGPQLALLDRSQPKASAELFVGAMQFAFGSNSIQALARSVLVPAFTLALCVTDEAARDLGYRTYDPVAIVWTLLGQDGKQAASKLLTRLKQDAAHVRAATTAPDADVPAPAAERGGDLDFDALLADVAATPPAAAVPVGEESGDADAPSVLDEALKSWSMFDTLRDNDRRAKFDSSLNKVQELMRNPQLWRTDPAREQHSLAQVLEAHRPTVINFGTGDAAAPLGEEEAALYASMVTYLLWAAVKRTCSGWQAAGRRTVIYCDELSSIAGGGRSDDDDDVIAAMFDKGRSRGLQMVMATQRPTQLPAGAGEAMASAGAQLLLGLRHIDVATSALRQLAGTADGSFAVDDLTRLPPAQAIARLTVGNELTPPFSLQVADWRQLYPEVSL